MKKQQFETTSSYCSALKPNSTKPEPERVRDWNVRKTREEKAGNDVNGFQFAFVCSRILGNGHHEDIHRVK